MSRRVAVEELDLLLIDGDNLLHDVRGGRDEGGVAWLLPRLIGWRPAHLRIVVGLDGHAAAGEPSRTRAAPGIEFQHAGSRSADDLLIDLLSAQPYAARHRTAVVTRDRGLKARARRAGGETRSVDWLMQHVGGSPSVAGPATRATGIGQGKPPRHGPTDAGDADEDVRRPWRPGRGATRKRGNPRRSPKGSRRR